MTAHGKWMPAFAGLSFAIIGAGAFWLMRVSADGAAAVQTDSFFPSAVAISLLVFGTLTAARDFRSSSLRAMPESQFRPCVLVTGSVIAFATIIERGGLLPAVFVSVMIAAFGSRQARLGQNITLSLCVATAIALVFVGLLGQPMKLIVGWP